MSNDLGEIERFPLVSVGIPVYNGAEVLERSVQSILGQTYRNLEIIIFDNGSTDGTELVCERLVKEDLRIRYERSSVNRGSSFSFNQTFMGAVGEYFMWSAADDFRAPDEVASAVRVLEENPTVIASTPITLGYIEGDPEPVYSVEVTGLDVDARRLRKLYTVHTNLPATAIYSVFRSSALRASGLWGSSIASDVALLQELAMTGAFRSNPEQVLGFVRRLNWNTVEQDHFVFTGQDSMPRLFIPGLILLRDRIARVWSMSRSVAWKTLVTTMIILLEVRRGVFRRGVKVLRLFVSGKQFRLVVAWVYWHLLHKDNYVVFDKERYIDRMVLRRFSS